VTANLIYHVAERAHWRDALARGAYDRSTREQSLEEVGFIHCSTPAQVRGVLDRYYEGVDDLVVLTIDADRFDAELRYEPGHGGAELFPHLYVALPVSAVSSVTDVSELDALLDGAGGE